MTNDITSNDFLRSNLEQVLQVAYDLPFKFKIIASLVESQEHLGLITASLKEQLIKQDLAKVKNICRLLMELMNLGKIPSGQVFDLLNAFLELQQDFYIYLILSSVNIGGKRLSRENEVGLKSLLDGVNAYMEKRVAPKNEALQVFENGLDPLTHLASQVSNQQQNGWELKCFSQISMDSEVKLQFAFSKVDVPTTKCKFSYPPIFYILPESTNLPAIDSADRYLINDILVDIIQTYSHNHTVCSKILLNIQQDLSVSFAENYQVYEAVVEAIFMELFRLPAATEKLVYYNTLIIDLCRESLDKIPSVLGRCIRSIFSKLDGSSPVSGMDAECIKRFADFTAIHLSNFGFSWKFSDWEYLLDGESTNQFVFVREVLEKCIRLSYYERIRNSVPESFEANGQIFPAEAPTHYFMLQDDANVEPGLLSLVEQLNTKLTNKEEPESIESQLKSIASYAAANSDCLNSLPNNLTTIRTPQSIAHEALFGCVLFQGSKSFSHLLNIVERHLPLLQKLNDSPEKKQLTCELISIFWEKNSQFLEIILGKLVNYRIIDPTSVVKWLISDEYLSQHYDQFFVWSILNTTLSKINLKQEQLKQKFSQVSLDSNMDGNDDESGKKELISALEQCDTEKRNLIVFCFQVNNLLKSGL